MLAAILISPPSLAAEARTFALQAMGFDTAVVGNDAGRLVQAWPGRPVQLAPGRWVAVNFEGKRSVWFDASGQVSRRGPYVEVRTQALPGLENAPDRQTLFSVWSQAGTGLLRADGSTAIDWQPGRGKWEATAHPQRYSWQPSDAGERIYGADGQLRLQLRAEELRAAGPFPGRPQYLICGPDEAACVLRNEAGATLWTAQVDDLLPLQGGGWLARQGNAWRRRDAAGQLAGDRTRVYAAGQYFPRLRQQADATTPSWPIWMIEHRVEREDGDALHVRAKDAVGGLMQADGRFVPVPGATEGRQLCPGTWRFQMRDGGERLGTADGQVLGPFNARSWRELDGYPALRVAVAANGQETLVDCQGRPRVHTPPVQRIEASSAGLMGTLVDESRPRLWLDASLVPHLLPEDSAIDAASRDGTLLAVRTAADGVRLYNVERERFVGAPFHAADVLLPGGVVFLRDGYYGFMDRDGNERLPPRYNGITPWGEDRLWSARYTDQGALDEQQTSLHRLDGSVIARWRAHALQNVYATEAERRDGGAVTQLMHPTLHDGQDNYVVQQWVDRDGRRLFLAVECRAGSKGAVIEPLLGPAQRTGANCTIPDQIRAVIAPLPQDPQTLEE